VSESTKKGGSAATGERIAEARRRAGLTQKQLAGSLGVSLWTVEELERGNREPRPVLTAVAEATAAQRSWLVGDSIRGQLEAAQVEADGEDRAADSPPADDLASGSLFGRQLVLWSIGLLVTIRFFTEVVSVLPRAANFVDIPIFIALVGAAIRQRRIESEEIGRSPKYLVSGLLFLMICAISVVVNPDRIAVAPVLVFIYGFLAPLAVYYAVYRIWPVGGALSLSRLLVVLGLLQLVVVASVDLPQFLSHQDPDRITGTFGENAYQLVFFMLVFACVVAGIFTFEKQRVIARFAPLLFVAILAVIFLAQYRALLVTTGLTVLAIGAILGSTRARGFLVGAIAMIAFLGTLSFVAQEFPVLRFADTVSTLRADPTLYFGARLGAVRSALRLFSENPRFILTGAGPGTYSSRAWQTFALSKSKSRSNVAGSYVVALTGGHPYHTDVSDKYTEPQLVTGASITGSKALSSPFSSYTSLLGEVGLLGALTILSAYVMALFQAGRMTIAVIRRPRSRDPLIALVFASAATFYLLLQLAFLENWLEVTRVTFLSWALLAIVTKEFQTRYPRVRP
jgi:transcriptional regulator with XRE-family HTH domain